MLSHDEIAEIRRLLAAGLSQRAVAGRLHVGLGTVCRIAKEEGLFPDFEPAAEEVLPEPIRCPGCGARLQVQPCLACALRDGTACEPSGRRRRKESALAVPPVADAQGSETPVPTPLSPPMQPEQPPADAGSPDKSRRNRRPKKGGPSPPSESYQLVIHCPDEPAQEELFEELRRRGYRCRVLTMF